MVCELAGRGFHRRAALACLVVLAVMALFCYWQPVVVSAAASRIFPQVEPVHMSLSEFLSAAIRFDPYCAEASERLAAKLGTASGASSWRPVVGFRASTSALQAWAAAEGPHGLLCRFAYDSGDPGSSQNQAMAMWSGVIEAPLSCISRVLQTDSASSRQAKLRAAELRVAQEEARAAARAIDMLRKAEALAMQGDADGAIQAYGELSLLIGLPCYEIRPVVVTDDGRALLAQLIGRALDADPVFLMNEWMAHDPDLIEAQACLSEASGAGGLLDAITLSAGFEWDQSSRGPRWHVGAAVAVGANMVGKPGRPADAHGHMVLLQRRVDALRARSTAQFARTLGQLRSVWAELTEVTDLGDPEAAQADARRAAEVDGIAFLAKLGVFIWKSQ